jgi:hypothetical protein
MPITQILLTANSGGGSSINIYGWSNPMNEGSTNTVTVEYQNYSPTTIYWQIVNDGTAGGDWLNGEIPTGSFYIEGTGNASFSWTTAEDLTTEGNQNYLLQVGTSVGNNNLLNETLTISDTSTTPPYPVTLATTGGSFYFTGGTNNITVNNSLSDFEVGTGDYTIEWWQWMLDTSGVFTRPFSMGSYPNAILGLSFENAVLLWANGGVILTAPFNRQDLSNTWAHFAVTRTSGTTRIFQDGVLIGANNASYNITSSTNFTIGNETSPSVGAGFAGYIKDFRFIKGVSVYTSAFTPPMAQLTATAETKLLFSVNSELGLYTDSSTSAHTVTAQTNGYAPVGPYDLALYVDAGNASSYSLADQTKWYDLSPAGNYLNLTNVSYSSNSGGSLYFDDGFSAPGYAQTASTSIASAQNGLTPRSSVSFWGIIQGNSNFQHIVGMRGGDKFHMVLRNNNQSLECRVETLGGDQPNYFDNMPDISASLGSMKHYAFVVNGTRTEVYINGSLVGETSNVTGLNTGTLGAFTIGRAASGDYQSEDLYVSQLRYYNRARGPKEIAAEFAATRSRYGV